MPHEAMAQKGPGPSALSRLPKLRIGGTGTEERVMGIEPNGSSQKRY